MKKFLFILIIACSVGTVLNAQTKDPLVASCVLNVGDGAKYLKDFRVQLGKGTDTDDLRYKAQMSLWKSTKYRFTLCNDENSKGQLIINIRNENNDVVASSYDAKSGKIYPYIDFVCNRSGIYQLCFDFYEGESGLGVGVVSMIR